MIDALHFLRPWWLLALVLLPLLWRALRADGGLQRSWARAVDAHLLPHLLAGAEAPRRAPLVLLSVAWIIACVALAGPAWERQPTPLYRNQAARVIALQLSPSMLAADLKPTRLARARFAIRDLLDVLGDGQVALLGYAGDAFVVAPMTDDGATVRNLLMELEPGVMPVSGNATGAAIRRGVELLQQSGAGKGEIVLVLDEASSDAAGEAQQALRQGVSVSVLAVGTAAGAPVSLPQGDFWKDSAGNIVVPRVDAASLRELARIGGGSYRALDGAAEPDLAGLVKTSTTDAAAAAATAPGVDSAHWLDRGPWLALLLLPLALAGFRRGWLAALPLVVMLQPQPAYALSWSDLWQRDDQQAWQSLQAGDAAAAAGKAQDPALRGAANFRTGSFEAATQDFSRGESADAAYNRGNALAQQQKFKEAIEAWNQALQRDPQHADAAANKQAVQDWLKQQQQKQGQDKNSSDKDQKDPHGAKPDDPQQGNQDASDSTQQSQDASAGESGQQQDGKSGQQGEAAQQGQPGAESRGEDRSGNAGESQQNQDQASRDGRAKPGDDKDAKDQGQAAAKADAQQQQAFQQQMQQALEQQAAQAGEAQPGQEGKDGKDGEKTESVIAAGKPGQATETAAEREQRQAVEQWLQRVPDDPGGLLRRKFQLEYERRQRSGQGPRQ